MNKSKIYRPINKGNLFAFLITVMILLTFVVMIQEGMISSKLLPDLRKSETVQFEITKDRTNETGYLSLKQDEDLVHGTFYFDMGTDGIIKPNVFEDIFSDPSHGCVRKYYFKINLEMDIVSRFIQNKNNRIPNVLADVIGYETILKCVKHNMPIGLIVGIMKVESFYDPFAVSSKRARGLMQVLDKDVDGEKIDHSRLHDIDYNIDIGMKILKSKLKSTIGKDFEFGDIDKALFYYVGEDEEYAKKVFKTMGEYSYFRQMIISKENAR